MGPTHRKKEKMENIQAVTQAIMQAAIEANRAAIQAMSRAAVSQKAQVPEQMDQL